MESKMSPQQLNDKQKVKKSNWYVDQKQIIRQPYHVSISNKKCENKAPFSNLYVEI